MHRAGDLIRKQIIQVDSGNIVGQVEDLLIDADTSHIAALVTTKARWLREAYVIPWASVVNATGDVVLVHSGTEPCAIHEIPTLEALALRKIHVTGTQVVTASGSKVGPITEVLILASGEIQGYTVGTGLFNAERMFVRSTDVEVLGTDAVIIKDDSVHESIESTASQATSASRVVLPFKGTPIVIEQSETKYTQLNSPATDDAAVNLGEELMHQHTHPHAEPPVTDQAAAAQMEPVVADPPPTEFEQVAETEIPETLYSPELTASTPAEDQHSATIQPDHQLDSGSDPDSIEPDSPALSK